MSELQLRKLMVQLDAIQSSLNEIRTQLGSSLAVEAGHGMAADAKNVLEAARRTLRDRQSRSAFFDCNEVFADPVWDMLLRIFIGTEDRLPLTIATASLEQKVSATIEIRCIKALTQIGMVALQPELICQDSYVIKLSEKGERCMRQYLEEICDE